jgi:2-C-methyl-D-erythritol 4-phosphate cytidylyltransferase
MTHSPNYFAVVPAAGVGKRMLADRPKQYLLLHNQTVIEHTLSRLLQAKIFTGIAVAISKEDPYWPELEISKHPQVLTAVGGKERADSVLSALNLLQNHASKDDWVLVHDAARPCITASDIHKLIATLKDDAIGGILALPSHDTLKQVKGDNIQQSLDRRSVWRALTPQMFRFGVLKQALEQTQGNLAITDEASALELTGLSAKIVEGRADNIKITQADDLFLAQFYLEQQ